MFNRGIKCLVIILMAFGMYIISYSSPQKEVVVEIQQDISPAVVQWLQDFINGQYNEIDLESERDIYELDMTVACITDAKITWVDSYTYEVEVRLSPYKVFDELPVDRDFVYNLRTKYIDDYIDYEEFQSGIEKVYFETLQNCFSEHEDEVIVILYLTYDSEGVKGVSGFISDLVSSSNANVNLDMYYHDMATTISSIILNK